MYLAYFGLNEPPFSITPDPRFLFMSQRHREALAHLLYGVGEYGGFVQLTGEIGTGKTTLCRGLLAQASAEVDVALILNPRQSELELVASICDELHIPDRSDAASLKTLVDRLNGYLLQAHARGRRTVVVIDEAQALSVEVLEQLRLLTNLETATRKLLQIILIGQPELRDLLARPELRQLAQRITARYHLTPLSDDESRAYVGHRLGVAGATRSVFEQGALRLVHRLSGGVPRLINVICDRALLAAYAQQKPRIDRRTVREAAAELLGYPVVKRWRRGFAWGLAGAALVLIGVAVAPALFMLTGAEQPRVAHQEPATLAAAEAVISAASGPRPDEESTGGLAANLPDAPKPAPPVGAEQPAAGESGGPTAQGDLDRLLRDSNTPTDTAGAFTSLFGLWGESYAGLQGQTACERAASAGLTCLYERGSWAKLSRYNRPAVLELMGADGRRHHVVIVGLADEQVTLDLGGTPIELPRAVVDPRWFGDFILLWRASRPGTPMLALGSWGVDVVWLRQRLDSIEGVMSDGEPSTLFDDELGRRVRDFQAKRGLAVDGVVGKQTLAQLQAAETDPSVPTLRH